METGDTVADAGEFGLIAEISAAQGTAEHVLIGPGDDAAHLSVVDGTYLVSTDLLIEGRHFRRDWSSAYEVGRKAAAVNLSDIAAMGGVARSLTVGFGVPGILPMGWVRDFNRGLVEEASHVGAVIVGGDVTASDQIVIAVTVMGEAHRPVIRGGAMPGDVVAFAGRLGWAGAGFAALSRGFRSPKAVVEAHRLPHPPYAAGPQASNAGATSMIDVSDGLLGDLGHIARASGVAINLESGLLEIAAPVATVGEALGVDPLTFLLSGGDDYALVATFSSQTELPTGWTRIGMVLDGEGVTVDGDTYPGESHQHFR
ncbi:MAG: thiamine-phosphate kinase [Nocardioidaceae bacterium]|nr:thiamine-phosphate kinase [Nocardioidaceae bacterium]